MINNLLIRATYFSSTMGVQEIHGFLKLGDIDITRYNIDPGGMTPLLDAMYSGVGASNVYAKDLFDADYDVNAITFVITDGWENASLRNKDDVRFEIAKSIREEYLLSHNVILIGINATQYLPELEQLAADLGTDFLDAGDISDEALARLAQFVTGSISSSSTTLTTGNSNPLNASF